MYFLQKWVQHFHRGLPEIFDSSNRKKYIFFSFKTLHLAIIIIYIISFLIATVTVLIFDIFSSSFFVNFSILKLLILCWMRWAIVMNLFLSWNNWIISHSLSDRWSGCAHPCKHKAFLIKSVMQSVSMRHYYINMF